MGNEETFMQEIEQFCEEYRSIMRKADPVSQFDAEIPSKEEIDWEYNRVFGIRQIVIG